jgi:uncharacterized alpha-E superfamily protein
MAVMNLLDRAVLILSAFSGLLAESTTRGYGWRFLDLGKRLERALQISGLLRAGLARAPFEVEPLLTGLLHIADSSITYRTRYFTALRAEYVLELLLEDAGNPRSLNFQLAGLVEDLAQLPQETTEDPPAPPRRLAEALLASLRAVSSADLAAPDAEGNLPALDDLLRGMQGTLQDLSDAITARHFSHLVVAQLSPTY